jgi:hypothetical protein
MCGSKLLLSACCLALTQFAHAEQTNTVDTKETTPITRSAPTNASLPLVATTNRMMLGQRATENFPVSRLLENGFKETEKNPGLWVKERISVSEVKALVGIELSEFRSVPGASAFEEVLSAQFKNGRCIIRAREGLGDSSFVRVTINTNLHPSGAEPSPMGKLQPSNPGRTPNM